jgi:hypothetical protein
MTFPTYFRLNRLQKGSGAQKRDHVTFFDPAQQAIPLLHQKGGKAVE